MSKAVEFVERSGRPMIWFVRLLVVATCMVWGALTGQSLILGFLTGWTFIGLSLLVGKIGNKICSKAPVGARRAGLVFYWLGVAFAIFSLGSAAYGAYVGADKDVSDVLRFVGLVTSTAVIYWAVGWGLHRALTTPSVTSPPLDGQVTSGLKQRKIDGQVTSGLKQRKIAISLAVVGAIAAPFVFDTFEAVPMTQVLVPLTAEERATITARLKETNDCQTLAQRNSGLSPAERTAALLRNDDWLMCTTQEDRLEHGGDFNYHPDVLKYLTINVAVAATVFAAIYGLAFLLPGLARCYWRWLNT